MTSNKVSAATVVVNTSSNDCCVHPFTLDSNGGVFTKTFESGTVVTKMEDLPTVSKEGYVFDGWFRKVGDFYYKLSNENLQKNPKGVCCDRSYDGSEIVYFASWILENAMECINNMSGCFSNAISFNTMGGNSVETMHLVRVVVSQMLQIQQFYLHL